MQPGIYDNLPNDEYHASDGISKSGLSRFADSPARFRWGAQKQTEALATGALIHTAILEAGRLDQLYRPSQLERFDERTRAYQNESLAAMGRILVKQADYDEARRIADAVASHPVAAELLTADLIVERSLAWIDPETGVLCRARPDGILRGMGAIVDIKTCEDATAGVFARAAHRYRYHWQDAYYRAGMLAADGWTPGAFVFLAVEKQPPYLVAAYELGERELILASEQIGDAMRHYAKCLAADDWPGHSDSIEVIEFPPYAFN